MGVALGPDDEGIHAPGPEINWNESRYTDFWDPATGAGGWFRIGARPNARYAEMSACVFLPDGRTAFAFDRSPVGANSLTAGGQTWRIDEPWRTTRVRFQGAMSLFDDPWVLLDPKRAFTGSPKADAEIDLVCTTEGLGSTMGQDQDQHRMIFLPGQADFHYQHMNRVVGTMRVGDDMITVDGRGGKDHSWGPRNWHAKRYLRWLTCCIDDDNGFMLTRAVGPTAETRSGFVWADRRFRVVDGFDMVNHYADGPRHELLRTEVTVRAGDVTWTAVGTPRAHLPLRHRQRNDAGEEATLRIVKHPAEWTVTSTSTTVTGTTVTGTTLTGTTLTGPARGGERSACGHLEYHDLIEGGVPVGLHE